MIKEKKMKKVLAILAVLLMVPFVSMAATMSDADLAAVTGQAGITIDISALNISMGLGTFTYGDLDGFTTTGSFTGGPFDAAGFVNVAFFPVPMHIGVSDLELVIDVGTNSADRTAVNIAGNGLNLTVDGIVMDVYLDSTNGAVVDYIANQAGGQYPGAFGFVAQYYANGDVTKSIGQIGISNISLIIPSFNIQISAH
jgi:hypothetical protein